MLGLWPDPAAKGEVLRELMRRLEGLWCLADMQYSLSPHTARPIPHLRSGARSITEDLVLWNGENPSALLCVAVVPVYPVLYDGVWWYNLSVPSASGENAGGDGESSDGGNEAWNLCRSTLFLLATAPAAAHYARHRFPWAFRHEMYFVLSSLRADGRGSPAGARAFASGSRGVTVCPSTARSFPASCLSPSAACEVCSAASRHPRPPAEVGRRPAFGARDPAKANAGGGGGGGGKKEASCAHMKLSTSAVPCSRVEPLGVLLKREVRETDDAIRRSTIVRARPSLQQSFPSSSVGGKSAKTWTVRREAGATVSTGIAGSHVGSSLKDSAVPCPVCMENVSEARLAEHLVETHWAALPQAKAVADVALRCHSLAARDAQWLGL
eukprot:gene1984-3024_t